MGLDSSFAPENDFRSRRRVVSWTLTVRDDSESINTHYVISCSEAVESTVNAVKNNPWFSRILRFEQAGDTSTHPCPKEFAFWIEAMLVSWGFERRSVFVDDDLSILASAEPPSWRLQPQGAYHRQNGSVRYGRTGVSSTTGWFSRISWRRVRIL